MKIKLLITITVLSLNASAQIPTSGLIGNYPFSGNTNDISGNGNNGTNNGAILTTDRFGNFNSAYSFDGTSSFISVPNVAQTGNAARSICAWVKFSGNNPYGVVSTGSPITSSSFNMVVNYSCNFGVMGYNNDDYPSTGITVNDNQWHNLIVVYDGAGNISTYVDGMFDNTGSITFNTSGQNNFIGKSNDTPLNINYFNGAIDDILFYNRELSTSEITQIYNATYCALPTTGLIANYPFSGNANDISGNGNNGTNHGATLTVDRFGNLNSAYSFDGISNYISTITGGPLGQSSRTISFWFKSANLGQMYVIGYGNPNGNGGCFNVALNNPCSGIGVDVSSGAVMKSDNSILNNQWHNCVLVVDSSISTTINDVSVYIDGIIQTSLTCSALNSTASINTIANYPFNIGSDFSGGRWFNGDLDDILIYNRALTQTEITAINCSNSITTGITNNSMKANFIIFPNPANNEINISTDRAVRTISIYTIEGQLIQRLNINSIEATIDISKLTSGLYFINIETSQGTFIKKLIKN